MNKKTPTIGTDPFDVLVYSDNISTLKVGRGVVFSSMFGQLSQNVSAMVYDPANKQVLDKYCTLGPNIPARGRSIQRKVRYLTLRDIRQT